LGHPCKFQRVSRLGSVTARHSSSGRQPNFAALKRGRHLYSAGRPSSWALAHISSSIFSLDYSQPSQIGCLPYFHTWCGLNANLGCRCETCCTRLAENTGRKKSSKIRHLGPIAQLCRTISLQLRHASTIGKNLLNSNICPHASQYGKLRPTNG